MLRVGLTGGIACGKSRVLRRIESHGIATLDLDRVAHQVMAPGGDAYREVVVGFGHAILAESGTIDRKALGELVFSDATARARLNAVVHPKVRAEERRRAAELEKQGHELLVTDAALLVESGLHLRFDRLVVVHCSRERQLERLRERDGLDPAQAAARIDAQMPAAEKRRYGHYQVGTEGGVDDTDRAVDVLAAELKRLARAPLRRPERFVERGAACLLAAEAAGSQLVVPALLIQEITTGGLEMERIAHALGLSGPDPWYRKTASVGRMEAIAGAIIPAVLWVLARRGADLELVASAAVSIARLVDREPARVADACLFGLALAEMALSGEALPVADRLGEWLGLASRWGEAGPGPRMTETAANALEGGPGARDALGSVLFAMARPRAASPGGLLSAVERLVAVAGGGG